MARLCPCCGCDKSDDAWSDLGKIPSGSPVEAIRHSLAVWEEAAKAGCQVCDAVCQVVGAATARHQQVFADCIALKAHGPPPWTLEISASVRADGWRDIEPRIWLYNLPGHHNPIPSLDPGDTIDVADSAASDRCFALCQAWVHKCRAEHPRCALTPDPPFPTRILDILTATPDLRLRVPADERDDMPASAPFVALSHPWGRATFLRTLTTNLPAHRRHIALAALPRNFRQAVALARRLGYAYLWIDSLCIVQDDGADWLREAARMADVYLHADLVLAATSAADADAGFLGPRVRPQFGGVITTTTTTTTTGTATATTGSSNTTSSSDSGGGGGGGSGSGGSGGGGGGGTSNLKVPVPLRYRSVLDHSDRGHRAWQEGPLEGRAWAFQERSLARRLLSFGMYELLWECDSWSACECGLSRLAPQPAAHAYNMQHQLGGAVGAGGPTAEVRARWRDCVVAPYSRRALTRSSDRLVALAAVARLYEHRLADGYVAGLWRGEMPASLGWMADAGGRDALAAGGGIPSWTWASLASAVMGQWGVTAEPLPALLALDHPARLGPNRLVDFGGASITLRGEVVRTRVLWRTAPYPVLAPQGSDLEALPRDVHIFLSMDCKMGVHRADGEAESSLLRQTQQPGDMEAANPTGAPPLAGATLADPQEGSHYNVWCLRWSVEGVGRNGDGGEKLTVLLLGALPLRPGCFQRLGFGFLTSSDVVNGTECLGPWVRQDVKLL